MFPSYAARFEGAKAITRSVTTALNMVDSAYGSEAHVLLIISTEPHPIMSAVTGGPPAEAEWSRRFPQSPQHQLVIPLQGKPGQAGRGRGFLHRPH